MKYNIKVIYIPIWEQSIKYSKQFHKQTKNATFAKAEL